MGCSTRIWLVVVIAAASLGCDPSPRNASWTFTFEDPALTSRAFAIEAEIREGGCTGVAVYSALVREGMVATAPDELPPGTVGLFGRARDSDCNWFAEGCVPVDLPQPDGASVTVQLRAATEVGACPGECAGGLCGVVDAGVDAAPDAVDAADTAVDAVDTSVPIDVPQPDGGCDPSTTPDTCASDTLLQCMGGMLVGTVCNLGCNSAGDACAVFVPANLETVTLPAPRVLADVVIGDASPDTWIFDTDTGAIDAITGFDRGSGSTSIRAAGMGVTGGIRFDVDTQRGGGPSVGVFTVDDLDVPAGTAIVGVGSHPLVFLVRRQAIIEGRIVVGADILAGEPMPGPGGASGGARMADGSGSGGGESGTGMSGPDGGGGGGSYGRVGGSGASGSDAAPGTSYGAPDLQPLRGGSGGGGGSNDTFGGLGGHGAGALQISAGTLIEIRGTATIDACGGGGRGGIIVGGAGGGGGGGGAGGAILIEAPTVMLAGRVGANGGSGGQGTQSPTVAGEDGRRGDPTMAPVAGTATVGVGGGGGDGSNAAGFGSDGLLETNGGGGGGGGGRVRINNAAGTGRGGYASRVLPDVTELFTVGAIGLR